MSNLSCQRIMVAIDGSEARHAAANYASRLARKLSATLIVVGVIDATVGTDPQDLTGSSELIELIDQRVQDEVNEIVEEARQVGVAEVERQIVVGDPRAVIVQAVLDHEADLLVIGSRRCSALQHLLTGSLTEYLVEDAPSPDRKST